MKLLLHACCGPCSLEPTRLLRARGADITIFYANSNIHPEAEYAHRLATLREWAAGESVPVEEGTYDPRTWERAVAAFLPKTAAGAVSAPPPPAAHAAPDGEPAPGETAASDCASMRAGSPNATQTLSDAGDADSAAASSADDPHSRAALDAAARRESRCRACYRLRLEEAARFAAAHGFEGLSTTLSVSPYQYTEVIREEVERAAGAAGLAPVFEDFRPYYPEATRRSRALGMYRQNYCGCRISNAEAAAERAARKASRDAERAAKLAATAEERAAEEAARIAHRAERAAYDAKQARKRAILKALREQERAQHT